MNENKARSRLDQRRAPIYEALERFRQMRVVPFDVPGHKRGRGNPELTAFLGQQCVGVDVNSMKPLDNLCHPVSVIREAEELAADAFGAAHAFLMVGGTTSSVQSMVLTACKRGDEIILPRNVHRSVLNALVLCGAVPVYVNPEVDKRLGISLGMKREQVEKAIKEYGFKGANIEPGYKDGYRGISIDDPALGPIMEVLEAGGAFLQIQTGMLGGADIGNNNPPALDRFLQAHPKLQVVLAHGGYPYMSEMLGLATKHPHLHICPDMYMFFPGGQLYAWNLNNLPDTFVYGSSYPFASIREPIEETLAFRSHPLYKVRDDVMEKYLYGNAARLLGLES